MSPSVDATHSDLRTGEAHPAEVPDSRSRWLLRGSLVVACAIAVVACWGLGSPAPHLESDPELARLLRSMVLLKAAVMVAAFAGLMWRFRWPLSLGLGSGYIAAAALASGSLVPIWNLTHVAVAAVLFHVGAAMLVVGALLDRSAPWRLPGSASSGRVV